MSVYPFLIITWSACSLSEYVCFYSSRFWNEFSVTSLASVTCYHHGDRPLASTSSIRRSDSSSVPCSALTRASNQMFVRQEKWLLRSVVCTLRNRSWHGRNSVQGFNARQIIMFFVFPYSDYLCISITNATEVLWLWFSSRWKTVHLQFKWAEIAQQPALNETLTFYKHLNYSSGISHKTILLLLCLFSSLSDILKTINRKVAIQEKVLTNITRHWIFFCFVLFSNKFWISSGISELILTWCGFPQSPVGRGAERCSFKRFEFDFKVGHSKNIFNNYSCSPPSFSIPPLLLSKICMVLQCWSWEAGKMTLLFCHRRIWWNVGVTNCFFCSKRLHSACDYHLAHIPPSVLAVVVFLIACFDAETVIVCSVHIGRSFEIPRMTCPSANCVPCFWHVQVDAVEHAQSARGCAFKSG